MKNNMKLGMAYVPSHLPNHIDADMKALKEIGCNEVLFAIQENHFYNLDGAIRFGANTAKDNGLEPYAVLWGFANTFGGGRISKVLLENPDMWIEDETGGRKAEACYNNPKIIKYFTDISHELLKNGFKGIFVDEPTQQVCFCRYCREKFYNSFNRELISNKNEQWIKEFQCNNVKEYVQKICSNLKAIDKKIRTIVCIMPRDRELWDDIVKMEDVDVFATDPYWLYTPDNLTIYDAVKYSEELKTICEENKKSSQIWLNCWGVQKGFEEEIYNGGMKLAQTNCDSMYTWSYRGSLGIGKEECDDPYTSWDCVVRLYKKLSGKE